MPGSRFQWLTPAAGGKGVAWGQDRNQGGQWLVGDAGPPADAEIGWSRFCLKVREARLVGLQVGGEGRRIKDVSKDFG